jgi:hypothetical protein
MLTGPFFSMRTVMETEISALLQIGDSQRAQNLEVGMRHPYRVR